MRTAGATTRETPELRTIPGVLDRGFELMRQHAATVATLAVIIVLPLSVVVLFLQIQFAGLDQVGDRFVGLDDSGGASPGLIITALAMSSLQVTLLAGALTPLVSEPGSPPAAELAGRLLRRLPAVLFGWALAKAAQFVGVFGFVVGAFAVMVFTSLMTPIIMSMTANPFRAFGLSFRLVGKNFGRVLAAVLLMVVVDNSLRLSFIAVPAALHAWTSFTAGPVLIAALSVLADLVGASFVALATIALLDDARVRADLLDLDVRFEAAGVAWK